MKGYIQGLLTSATIGFAWVIAQYIYIGEMQGYQIHIYIAGFMVISWILGYLRGAR